MRAAPLTQLVFFWDYDTQWGADRSRAPGGPKTWGHLDFENTERLLELHGRYRVPACFAVVGAAALPGERPYHDPEQIRRIHAGGHEVASHTFHHEWLPGLGRDALRATLRQSKDALEQCIGNEVVTLVPPQNQPFDYPQGWSFSLSERREAGPDRTDLRRLCDELGEAGYRFCRVAYRPLYERLFQRIYPYPAWVGASRLEQIGKITCVRINTPDGFDQRTLKVLDRCSDGGVMVVHGHPHALHTGNSQDETWLVPFLERVHELERQERIALCLPRDLLSERVHDR